MCLVLPSPIPLPTRAFFLLFLSSSYRTVTVTESRPDTIVCLFVFVLKSALSDADEFFWAGNPTCIDIGT